MCIRDSPVIGHFYPKKGICFLNTRIFVIHQHLRKGCFPASVFPHNGSYTINIFAIKILLAGILLILIYFNTNRYRMRIFNNIRGNQILPVSYTHLDVYKRQGIWGGCDNNQKLKHGGVNNGGTTFHKDIWRNIMNRVHEGLSDPGFAVPDSIETAEICRKSGKRAVSGVCNHDPRGNAVYTLSLIHI